MRLKLKNNHYNCLCIYTLGPRLCTLYAVHEAMQVMMNKIMMKLVMKQDTDGTNDEQRSNDKQDDDETKD